VVFQKRQKPFLSPLLKVERLGQTIKNSLEIRRTMQKGSASKKVRPLQKQNRPGTETKMIPVPVSDYPNKSGSEKLRNKIALITGGDSGIGKAVAILFAKEGADIAIAYLSETSDARDTAKIIEQQYGRKCLLIKGDLSKEKHCGVVVKKTIQQFGSLDILVNNAAIHFENKDFRAISTTSLRKTFDTNIISFFWVTKAAIPYHEKRKLYHQFIIRNSLQGKRRADRLCINKRGDRIVYEKFIGQSCQKKYFV
jgi:hypothetical protein